MSLHLLEFNIVVCGLFNNPAAFMQLLSLLFSSFFISINRVRLKFSETSLSIQKRRATHSKSQLSRELLNWQLFLQLINNLSHFSGKTVKYPLTPVFRHEAAILSSLFSEYLCLTVFICLFVCFLN